jgi:hypothetical protein
MGNGYITNTSAQQGEASSRNESRAPANQNESIAPRESDDFILEGPEEIPHHAHTGKPVPPSDKPGAGLHDSSGVSMGEKIKR